MADAWLLLAFFAGSASFSLLAASTPGRLMAPLVWLATTVGTVWVYLLLAAVAGDDYSLSAAFGLAVVVCGALGCAISARARPRRSMGPALVAAMVGVLTPWIVLYTALGIACAGGACLD